MKTLAADARVLKTLGDRLRRLRKDSGVTQGTLARRAGLDPRYYSRIERGEVNATYLTLMKITTSLRLCPGTLFFPDSAADESKANVCALTSQMRADNNRKALTQTAAFAKYVLGVKPKLAKTPVHKKRGHSLTL